MNPSWAWPLRSTSGVGRYCSAGDFRAGSTRSGAFENQRLELLEFATRLDSELLGERPSRISIGLKRFGLASRAIQREHELGAWALPERRFDYHLLELAGQLGVSPALQICLNAVLERHEPKLLQPHDLMLGELRIGELRQWRPARQRKSLAKPCGGKLGLASAERFAALGGEALEAPDVELIDLDLEQVAGRAGYEELALGARTLGFQHLPQLGDVDLKRLLRGVRGLASPQLVDQAVGRDDLAAMERSEDAEFQPLSGQETTLPRVYRCVVWRYRDAPRALTAVSEPRRKRDRKGRSHEERNRS